VAVIARRGSILAVAAVASALLAVNLAFPPVALFSADCGPKLWQTLAFAEGHDLPRVFDYPAADLDPDRRFIPPFVVAVESGLVSQYPVLYPLLAAAPMRIGGDRMMRLTPIAGGVLTALAAGLIASRLRRRQSAFATAAVVLTATPLSFYTLTFWEHTTATAMLLGGLAVVVTAHTTGRRLVVGWVIAGALVGLSVWVRTEMLVLLPILACPLLLVDRRNGLRATAAASLAAASGIVFGAVAQRLLLGRWLPMHLAYHSKPMIDSSSPLTARFQSLGRVFAPDAFTLVATVLWLLALAIVLTPRWRTSRLALSLGLATVAASGIAALVAPAVQLWAGVRPTDAFPYAAPAATWIIVAALPVVLWGQSTAEVFDRRRLLLALTAVWFAFAVLTAKPVESPEWGTRILLPTVILLTTVQMSFSVTAGRWRGLRRLTIAATIVAALVIQGLGLTLLHHGIEAHENIVANLVRTTQRDLPVVTDSYLIPLLTGRRFDNRKILYCNDDRALRAAVSRVGDRGLKQWTYVSVDRVPAIPLDPGSGLTDDNGRVWYRTDRTTTERPRPPLQVAVYEVRSP